MLRQDLGCIEAWKQTAGRFALLTPAEEIRLGHLIQRGLAPDASARDRQRGHRARQRMITANLRMVVTLSAKYAPALD